jgi:hypothetical protein
VLRKLHYEELHNLYALSDIVRMIKSKRMRCTGHVALVRQKCVQCFSGKAQKKGSLGRPRHRRENDIKMDLKK